MPPILNAQSVTKQFGATPLFRSISLTVEDGDRIGPGGCLIREKLVDEPAPARRRSGGPGGGAGRRDVPPFGVDGLQAIAS